MPTLSPASPRSSDFLNISTPVHVVLTGSLDRPTSSISSPTLTVPVSMRPVTTVPRPPMEKTSSTGIRKGLSSSRLGVGTAESTAAISLRIDSRPSGDLSPLTASSAEPRMIGIASPSNL